MLHMTALICITGLVIAAHDGKNLLLYQWCPATTR